MNYEQWIPKDFSGVISIYEGNTPIVEKAYGYADMPNQRPNLLSTRFVTASAGKAFTATGILRLIEEGRLGFEHQIGDLLDFDLKQIDPHITVRQLLTHTSGIPDYCDERIVPNYADIFKDYPNYKIRTSRDFIPLFIDMPMAYPRGETFYYNNTGYVVLGLIIEGVTGAPFDRYLAQNVFEPCGMRDTGYFEYDRLPANCANVYIYDKERAAFYTNIYSSGAKGTGDGGAFLTAPDAMRFWKGLHGGKVISRAMIEQMTSPQVEAGVYGLGLWLEKMNGRCVPHFEGCEPGIGFISSYDEAEGFMVTLMSNRGDDVWKINRDVLRERYGNITPHFDYGM